VQKVPVDGPSTDAGLRAMWPATPLSRLGWNERRIARETGHHRLTVRRCARRLQELGAGEAAVELKPSVATDASGDRDRIRSAEALRTGREDELPWPTAAAGIRGQLTPDNRSLIAGQGGAVLVGEIEHVPIRDSESCVRLRS
jgi:hypothetical protein